MHPVLPVHPNIGNKAEVVWEGSCQGIPAKQLLAAISRTHPVRVPRAYFELGFPLNIMLLYARLETKTQ